MLTPDDPGPEYELRWPRALFVTELDELVALDEEGRRYGLRFLSDSLPRLVREAFAGPTPLSDLKDADIRQRREEREARGWDPDLNRVDRVAEFAALLQRAADRLLQQQPRPYWHRRQNPSSDRRSPRDRQLDLQNGWLAIIFDLAGAGYLDQATRPDDRDAASRDHRLARLIAEDTGLAPHHWPRDGKLYDEPKDENIFYTLVEAVHQLVARPRTTSINTDGERHTSSFSRSTGKGVYRWRVNTLFAEQDSDLELAETGEDQGLLVHRTADGRQELLDQARHQVVDSNQALISHAIKLFRSRDTSVEDKRSACIALAGVLEARRALLKTDLLSKDEGALFNIANNFAVRHQDAGQQREYGEAYLDWIFWWYLATVELTNRLLAREETTR